MESDDDDDYDDDCKKSSMDEVRAGMGLGTGLVCVCRTGAAIQWRKAGRAPAPAGLLLGLEAHFAFSKLLFSQDEEQIAAQQICLGQLPLGIVG